MSPDIPGALSWAAEKMAFLISLLVMLVYFRSSGLWLRSNAGLSFRLGGSGNRCFCRTSHFCEWEIAGVTPSPQSMGGDVYVLLLSVHFQNVHMFWFVALMTSLR